MILILYGSNSFLRERKVQEILAEYKKKYPGSLGFSRTNANEQDITVLRDTSASFGLFAAKRFVLVRHGFAAWGSALCDFLEQSNLAQDSDIVLLFVEDEIGQDLLVRAKKLAKLQHFTELSGPKLRQFIENELAARHSFASPEAMAEFIGIGWKDPWKLSNVMEQAILYAGEGHAISKNDIQLFAKTMDQSSIFPAGDAVLSKDRASVFTYIAYLAGQGEDIGGISQYMLWLVKHFLAAHAGFAFMTPIQFAKKFALHPFVVQKLFQAARHWTHDEARRLARRAHALDKRKTIAAVSPRLALDAFAIEQ